MLRMKIRQHGESHVKYGHLRIHILLRREGLKVGKNRVYSLEGLEPHADVSNRSTVRSAPNVRGRTGSRPLKMRGRRSKPGG